MIDKAFDLLVGLVEILMNCLIHVLFWMMFIAGAVGILAAVISMFQASK